MKVGIRELLNIYVALLVSANIARGDSEGDDKPIAANARGPDVQEKASTPDPCERLREKASPLSNEEIAEYMLEFANNTQVACKYTAICKLHKKQDNVCEPLIDKIGKCFPATNAGQVAIVSCMATLSGIHYDETDNATRTCRDDGTWDEKTNYSSCKPLDPFEECFYNIEMTEEMTQVQAQQELDTCRNHARNVKLISYIGRGLALISLVISFCLFWTLKSIRCWRNIIHWNLVASFILRIVLWFIIYSKFIISMDAKRNNAVLCRILVTIFNYSQATNYFWMFVEGLYLHMMVVLAYSYDRIKLKVYNAIGWGIPALLTLIWAILKSRSEDYSCWLSNPEYKMVDYFFQIPIIILLMVNAIILGNVVRILFLKLRTGYVAGGAEAAQYTQYTKAVKAAVFLFPLLGVTYIIFLAAPDDAVLAFWYFNTFLQAFQGFFVCLIYCFANNEIQRALVKKINHLRWQINWPCCVCWKKDRGALNRSGSNASLSRTNHTIVQTKLRSDGGIDSTRSTPLMRPKIAEGKSTKEKSTPVNFYSRYNAADAAKSLNAYSTDAKAKDPDITSENQAISMGLLSDQAV